MQEEPQLFSIPLFQLAFRPFFLLGALFALTAMVIWLGTLNGWWALGMYGGSFFWHMHEMLFGFVAVIVVGFLLTAVQNWTGRRGVNGLSLAILVAIWLVARIGFLVVQAPSIWLAIVDISFLVVSAVFLAMPLVAVRQWRNLIFVPILGLFALADGMMHVGIINGDHALVVSGTQGALGLICVLMITMAGRVIPIFTANGTGTARVTSLAWLEWTSIGSVWLLMIVLFLGLDTRLPKEAMFGLLAFAALVNFIRWFRWRWWITFGVALLWTLHLAYLFIIAGFVALALAYAGFPLLPSVAWHLITVGGMGGLILAMISRVSLGHTGRPIVASGWMVPAFVCVFVAALTRTLLVIWMPGHYQFWLDLSGLLWIAAFGSFVGLYAALLLRRRADNKPG